MALAEEFGLKSPEGVLVADVMTDTPAAKAGLKPGDLILRANENTVRNMSEFSLEMEKVGEGQVVNVEILRIGIGVFGQVERRYAVKLKAQKARQGNVL